MSETLTIPVTRLRKGDVLPGPNGWTAGGDAARIGDTCHILVWSTADGGSMFREWTDITHTLTIERPTNA